MYLKITKNSLLSVHTILNYLYKNRFLQLSFFFLLMYGLFYCTISFGTMLQNYLQFYGQKLFLALPFGVLQSKSGIIKIFIFSCNQGIGITLNFIPIMIILLFGMHLLVSSGYLAHITKVMDQFFQRLSLPSTAILPMIMAFNCNVPAIASTRFINNKPQRIIAILIMPFISCNARLTIYVTFAAMFGAYGSLVIFSLYVLGILMAILTGVILNKYFAITQTCGRRTYNCKINKRLNLKAASADIYESIKEFITHAGLIIIITCFVVNLVFYYLNMNDMLQHIGTKVSYFMAPIGIGDNWQAAIALLSGIIGKEFMLVSLNMLHNSGGELLNPIVQDITVMFATKHAAYAYLVFTLLYVPCVSVLGAIKKELGMKWAVFAAIWPTVLAYCVATIIYNLFCLKISLVFVAIMLALVYMLVIYIITNMPVVSRQRYKTIPIAVIIN